MEGVRPYPEDRFKEFKKHWLNMTLWEAFKRTCDTHPEREALVEGEQRLTFSQVRERVVRAALAFLKLGLCKRSPVLFHLPNWVEAVYTYLGLTCIGAVPVLLLPRQGAKELEHFCSLTEAVAWIGPSRYGKTAYLPVVQGLKEKYGHFQHLIVARDETPPGTISLSRLMEETEVTAEAAEQLDKIDLSPDDVLHLAPTGGTTGISKLVPKTHNSHLIKSYYFSRHLERSHREVMMPVGPLTHDGPHLYSLCSWILFGGKLVIQPSTRAKDILEQLEKERVTYFFTVPTLVTDILAEPDLEKYDLSSLTSIMLGGARVNEEFVRTVREKLKVSLHPGYGATEGPGTFPKNYDSLEVVSGTYGRGACPYDIYKIIDEEGRVLPRGQEGEIVFRGPCMFTGYYKSEEDNRKVFTPDGFFCTGDIGKLDEQGNIIITGRKKDIIRRGAESISAPEVESFIVRHPKILRTAAVGMPDLRLGERICAYVQLKPGEKLTFEALVEFLKSQGASTFYLPERLEVVDELPFTAMDKVDKKKLRDDIAKKLGLEGNL